MTEDHPEHWYCIYCEEYHLNEQSCSVNDIHEMRDERYEMMFEDQNE